MSTSASGNASGQTAGCKINLAFDLLSGEILSNALHTATNQDKNIGWDLLDLISPNDLVVRDMGYFGCESFARIESLGAYWLSRLPLSVEATAEGGKFLIEILKKHRGETDEDHETAGFIKVPPRSPSHKNPETKAQLIGYKAFRTLTLMQMGKLEFKEGRFPPLDGASCLRAQSNGFVITHPFAAPFIVGLIYDAIDVTSRLILAPTVLSATSRSCSD